MKNRMKVLLLAALPLALAASASPASAQISRLWSACGGNAFNTCASVEVILHGTTMTVRVQNWSGSAGTNTYAGTVFTGIGFDNLPVTAVYDVMQGSHLNGASTVMSGPSIGGTPAAWVAYNNTQIGGGLNLDLVGKTSSGVKDGVASQCAAAGQLPGGSNVFWASFDPANPCVGGYSIANQGTNSGWVVFSFQVQPHSLTQADLDNATLLVKGQNGPNGGSTELICAPGDCAPTVVPEPITLVLLGSGLLGVGGAHARRRRRERAAELG